MTILSPHLKLLGRVPAMMLLLLAVLLQAGCQVADGSTTAAENSFTVGSSARIEASIENGSLRVESSGTAGDTVLVNATIRNPEQVQYETSQEGSTVRISAQVDDGFNLFGGNGGVDIVVSVPQDIDLDLVSSNGEINVDGINGSVSAETSNGRLSIVNVVGDVNARTSNGRITISDTTGQVEARTSNGAIDFRGELTPGSENSLTTSNGSVDVTLVNTPGLEISASTSNGNVNHSLPVTITGQQEENELEGIFGEGGAKLEIQTSNGSISIK